ncbi:hypothetical protein BKA81DRAFT_142940 [Phyllosticta paracitricarpa]
MLTPNSRKTESLVPTGLPPRPRRTARPSRDEIQQDDAEETPTEADSDSDTGRHPDRRDSREILGSFDKWKESLESHDENELDHDDTANGELAELNAAHLAKLTEDLDIDDATDEEENDGSEASLLENRRPIARLTKGYVRSNVSDSDHGSRAESGGSTSTDGKSLNDKGKVDTGSSATKGSSASGFEEPKPSKPSACKPSEYGWMTKTESYLEAFPPFDFEYVPRGQSANVVVSEHSDRARIEGGSLRTASFGLSVQQRHLKRAGFAPIPYDIAMSRAAELALMDCPELRPDHSKHPIYAKQKLEIPPRVPPFQDGEAWSRAPKAYRVLELENSDLRDCCLNAPTCNDCNYKICDACGSTCAPNPCWCVVTHCSNCPVIGGNVCRYHVEKWEAKGRPGQLQLSADC